MKLFFLVETGFEQADGFTERLFRLMAGRLQEQFGSPPRREHHQGKRAQLEEARKKWLEAEKKKPFYERIGYGNTLVGANSDCQAQITVEYVILNKK